MGIKNYSAEIKTKHRGSNAMDYLRMKRNAYREAKRLSSMPEVAPALDVGCGLGYIVQYCEENGIPCHGFDIDHRQLSYARTRMKKRDISPKLYEGDARKLPFKDNSFGYVNSWGMLMMIPYAEEKINGKILSKEETKEEVKKVLSEMKRVARVDAEIRIITFSEKEERETSYYKATPDELRSLAVEVGLVPVKVDYHEKHPEFIDAVFRK